ncbi:tRNA pseudouridine(55) synthase TruB [Thermogemmatispora tikiterensis]|uniref:tRNA pseudouridine synthase B n=1 Tax=Thermogemmatispora tikiterensis TaxID=1825093 RepID=A0A328VLL9_9CHLR|nr:tRNA pseudouridine(55) synthase TruB [Thermogemmatispora tikiterensis]RAQ98059.1 tRNA pseudouridine(55) synthase TruB [Thermogemmatispora tikiterensis]
MDGILNINKPVGLTSHDVVARVRRLLRQQRVGHAGTLDPLASGVLPVCVGLATRVADYLSESGKAYQAEIVLGVETDTYDREGQVLNTQPVPDVSREQIESLLRTFIGPQLQVPPPYSAIKLQGEPAYRRARAGESLKLEARPVVIERLVLLAWEKPRLQLEIECSKGTYIRSLAHDLGQRLGCGAYLSALLRTRSGPLTLQESITLEQLDEALASGNLERYLLPLDIALQHYPALVVDAKTLQRVLHGNSFRAPGPESESLTFAPAPGRGKDGPHPGEQPQLARVCDEQGRTWALAVWKPEQRLWQPMRVFGPERGS